MLLLANSKLGHTIGISKGLKHLLESKTGPEPPSIEDPFVNSIHHLSFDVHSNFSAIVSAFNTIQWCPASQTSINESKGQDYKGG
jgi:hypothetical protein